VTETVTVAGKVTVIVIVTASAGQMHVSHAEFFNFLGSQHNCNLFSMAFRKLKRERDRGRARERDR